MNIKMKSTLLAGLFVTAMAGSMNVYAGIDGPVSPVNETAFVNANINALHTAGPLSAKTRNDHQVAQTSPKYEQSKADLLAMRQPSDKAKTASKSNQSNPS